MTPKVPPITTLKEAPPPRTPNGLCLGWHAPDVINCLCTFVDQEPGVIVNAYAPAR